jgi:hypothetical protein
MLDNNISISKEMISNEIIEYFKKYLDIENEDLTEGSYLAYLIDVISILTSNNLFHNEMIYRESFLETSKLFDSIVNNAKYIGYTPKESEFAKGIITFSFNLKELRAYLLSKYLDNINEESVLEITLPEIDLNSEDLTIEEKLVLSNTKFFEIMGNSMLFTCPKDIKLFYYIQTNGLIGYTKDRNTGEITNLNIRKTIDETGNTDPNYYYEFDIKVEQREYKYEHFQMGEQKPGKLITKSIEDFDNIKDIKVYIQNENNEFELWKYYDSLYNMNYTTKGYTLYKTVRGWDIIFGNGIFGQQPLENKYMYIFYTTNRGTDGEIINNVIDYSVRTFFNLKLKKNNSIVTESIIRPVYVQNKSNFYGAIDNETEYTIKRNAQIQLKSQQQLISKFDYDNIGNIIDNRFYKIKSIIKRNDILQSDINIFTCLNDGNNNLLKTYNIHMKLSYNELRNLNITSLFPIEKDYILEKYTTYDKMDENKLFYLFNGIVDLEMMKLNYYSVYKTIFNELISDVHLSDEYLNIRSFEMEYNDQNGEYTLVLNTNKLSEQLQDISDKYEVDVIIYNKYKNKNIYLSNIEYTLNDEINMNKIMDDDNNILNTPVIYTVNINANDLFFDEMNIEVIVKNVSDHSANIKPNIFYNTFIAKDDFKNSIYSNIYEKIDNFGNKSYYIYDVPSISYECISEYENDEIYDILDEKFLEYRYFINDIKNSNSTEINVKTMETDGIVKNMKYNKHNNEVEKLLMTYSDTDELKRNIKYIVAFFIANDPDNEYYNKFNQIVSINYKDELVFEEPYNGMMVYNNEDENMYVYNGRIWTLPYFDNPLYIKLQLFTNTSIDNEIIKKIKDDIYNKYNSIITGSDNFKLYKSSLIQIAKKYSNVVDCKIIYPQFDIIFDPDEEKIKKHIQEYSEQYIYIDRDNIDIVVNTI